jgi:predicted O-methyltransferase YrrM
MSDRLKTLQRLAAEVPEDLAIVELGVHRGESLKHLAIGTAQGNGAKVYGIDLWGWVTDDAGREKHRKRRGFQTDTARKLAAGELDRVGVADVTLIQGATHEIAKAWSRPIGLLYIDAAHDEASVAQDWEDWSPFLEPGAWVAFDDAQEGEKVNRVLQGIVVPSGLLEPLERAETDGRLAFARRK